MTAFDPWSSCVAAPPDPILALAAEFANDPLPNTEKANLGVGAYRDEEGNPWILPVVRKAEQEIVSDPSMNHEYLPIAGYAPFLQASARLLFGKDAKIINEGRLATNQTISGSGANHLGAEFVQRFYPFPTERKVIYVTDPTWPNHFAIFRGGGLETETYTYYDPKHYALDFEGMIKALLGMPDRSVVLLHACAHNPSGVDPTQEQWQQIAAVFQKKQHFAFFDSAYQGFASGDFDRDAYAVRYFADHDIPMLVCQSFAKNAGLYGERIGALHVPVKSSSEVAPVHSQLNSIQRSELSSMPAFGARIVAKLINNPEFFAEWQQNVKTMAGRIEEMRKALYSLLVDELKTPGSWKHILEQTGMFSFLGLDKQQCARLVKEGHIYLVATSRISMAGLNKYNLKLVATWIDRVVRSETKL
ncbi:aspartate transaminase [Malassezia vespertilionis]|uniref:Aspartate aminotransferase n=1 Tax=Malassezia vespertilionis TaxID=2020962 RepID=A0A2N1JBE1_9BASI|nr:aspartate transaminase [Malassezia vespertilionis]PKI83856.1 Aat2p [Malassezia vespertilionis]WFD06940.1 aspartate transaminase [Malassezia vespertilionis]